MRVAIHIPSSYVTGGAPDHPYLLARPDVLRALMHEMGHAVSYVLSCPQGGDISQCVHYATTEVAELASHVMERCVTRMHNTFVQHICADAHQATQRIARRT
jgi:oligoendopeptidase F